MFTGGANEIAKGIVAVSDIASYYITSAAID